MRWVSAIVAAVSALAFVLTVWLWLRSHYAPMAMLEVPMREVGGHYVWEGWRVASVRGMVGVGREHWFEKTPGATDTHTEFENFFLNELMLSLYPDRGWGPFDFSVIVERGDDEMARWSEWWVACPWWFVTCLTLAYPAWWGRGWWRRRRSRRWVERGMCGTCGYDLRASGGRCSECGAAAVVNVA